MAAMDVQDIIDAAGGVGKLATKLGVSHSTVCDWKRGDFIPGARLPQISRELGIAVDAIAPLVRERAVAEATAPGEAA